MRSEEAILADARDEAPFSNGTEGYGWMENWCWRPCQTPAEKAWQAYENGDRKKPLKAYPGGCPLIMAAMIGKTPVEWLDQWDGKSPYPIATRFHCTEFIPPDEGGGNPGPPRPRREPPNMDGLFPRPPRAIRMLKPYVGRTTKELIDA